MREIGRLENLKIAMIGDLANGRTVHSLAALLSLYPGVKMYFVAPDVVRMKDDVKDFLSAKNVPWEEVDDLHEVGGGLDGAGLGVLRAAAERCAAGWADACCKGSACQLVLLTKTA